MPAKLTDLTSLEQLSEVLDNSNQRTQLIFKHSNTCPISTTAYKQMQSYLQNSPSENVDYSLIVVQTARNISNEVAAKLGVVHESPQAILVKNGQAVWNKSHFDITQKSLTEAINNN
jgi:bacillithiol system protein YtxJ